CRNNGRSRHTSGGIAPPRFPSTRTPRCARRWRGWWRRKGAGQRPAARLRQCAAIGTNGSCRPFYAAGRRWKARRAGRRASGRSAGGGAPAGVLAAELVDPAGGIDDLLLARIEGVAGRAHFNLQVLAQRRTRLEGVAAAAD